MSGDIFHWEGDEALAQAAQRSCGCPIPGGAQGQVGWSPGQPCLVPDLEVGDSACGKGVRTWRSLEDLPTQVVLWFYDGNPRIFDGLNIFAFHFKYQKQSQELDKTLVHISVHCYSPLHHWSLQGQQLQSSANNTTAPGWHLSHMQLFMGRNPFLPWWSQAQSGVKVSPKSWAASNGTVALHQDTKILFYRNSFYGFCFLDKKNKHWHSKRFFWPL